MKKPKQTKTHRKKTEEKKTHTENSGEQKGRDKERKKWQRGTSV